MADVPAQPGENEIPVVALTEDGVSEMTMIEPRFEGIRVKVSDGDGGFRDSFAVFCEAFTRIELEDRQAAYDFASQAAEAGPGSFLMIVAQYVSCC